VPAVNETLRVEGLRELQRAFKVADVSLHRELRSSLRQVAEPVRADAERLAVAAIPTVGIQWSRMRVGVTTTSVYVAPRQRGTRDQRKRRPKFAGLLLGRAMEPALQHNQTRVMSGMQRVLDEVGRDWENA
jgi:hypothetical protein